MQAVLLMDERRVLAEHCFVEMTNGIPFVLSVGPILNKDGAEVEGRWRFDSVRCAHYAQRERDCFQKAAGKGDHKHLGEREVPCTFTTLDQWVDDFLADVARL